MQISDITKSEYLCAFQKYLEGKLSSRGFALGDAMLYATVDGGKRIRPLLVYLGARMGESADTEDVLALAYAVELVHSYSLVHDDLPCMDNDDFRRGKLSVHKKYGEANGVLVGDALLTEAARSLFESAKSDNFVKAAHELMKGAAQMVDGQVKDLAGCRTFQEYLDMYSLKTGALIVSSIRAGALLAGASGRTLECASEYARHLGLAFQIADDLLDDDGEPSIINLIGRDVAKNMLEEETAKCLDIAKSLKNAEELKEFAMQLAVRKK